MLLLNKTFSDLGDEYTELKFWACMCLWAKCSLRAREKSVSILPKLGILMPSEQENIL
jgi:hypothetical protein